ncbi:MAG: hypothetical protein ACRC7C_05900 [Beijerinckiaceae bacterium]
MSGPHAFSHLEWIDQFKAKPKKIPCIACGEAKVEGDSRSGNGCVGNGNMLADAFPISPDATACVGAPLVKRQNAIREAVLRQTANRAKQEITPSPRLKPICAVGQLRKRDGTGEKTPCLLIVEPTGNRRRNLGFPELGYDVGIDEDHEKSGGGRSISSRLISRSTRQSAGSIFRISVPNPLRLSRTIMP